VGFCHGGDDVLDQFLEYPSTAQVTVMHDK
jgi:hypothetical protein